MKIEKASDNSLLSQYLDGDYSAFEVLYTRHKGGVYRYLLRQLHNEVLTEDIFQDVWSRVITQADSFNANSRFSTWLYTIARHKLIDHIRHVKVVDTIIETPKNEQGTESTVEAAKVSTTPEAIHQQNQQWQAIDLCLQKLPTHQLDCFLLREESGLALSDIAIIVNAGLEATKSRLRSAYSNLKLCLEKRIDVSDIITRGEKYTRREAP
ncbi:sigma-70 family RNA polymerase sigma factor [Glaciecola petra]|uniref:Sigma-70 family RNA polymerase sigma factor n=1 Tax=Glaciecola petra TaxID=3075602 RepID=A0ABU2ZQS6_9ALTE|nr:sigma-70 family RNA polymerase sigma factor [Aestuariibacter sp. P117]MDT0594991.1 sigma-70 family RNA polymerase sigma factor [Aestuariibacter sp. P117]